MEDVIQEHEQEIVKLKEETDTRHKKTIEEIRRLRQEIENSVKSASIGVD